MTPAPHAASGILITPTGTFRKRTAATTSTRCMESTSTPESSCRISGCSATTNLTTGRFSSRPGLGVQFLWRPNGWLSVLGNQYALGAHDTGALGRIRYHTDYRTQ